MYKASQELVDILEKNGFRNKSYLYVPDFGKDYSLVQPYNRGAYKRVDGMGYGKTLSLMLFNIEQQSMSFGKLAE